MKTFTIDNVTYNVPNIVVNKNEKGTYPVFEITEGDFKGALFSVSDISVDSEIENNLIYSLYVSEGTNIDSVKPVIDNFLISVLYEEVKRQERNENKATK